MKKLFVLVLFLGTIFSANANYKIEAKYYENEKLISSPVLIVKPANKASTSVKGLYTFSVTATENNAESVHLKFDHKHKDNLITIDTSVLLNKETKFDLENESITVLVSKVSS